jgi:DNA-binding NarL/FixJ family response regulator
VVTTDPIKVVIADDHTRMRGTVRRALESGGCLVCGEAATADEAVALVRQHAPDVALLDIHMPGSGIRAAREVARDFPGTVVVMLTQSAEDDDLFDSVRAGASGYLLKSAAPADLPAALRAVLAGEAAMPPQLVARILNEFKAPRARFSLRRPSAVDRLSAREREVMSLLAEGKSTQDVAQHLFLSPTTIRVHVSTVLRKLQVKDRASAFELLRDEG